MRESILKRLRRTALVQELRNDTERSRNERERAVAERDAALTVGELTRSERDRALAGEEAMRVERDAAIAERDAATREREVALGERAAAQNLAQAIGAERAAALAEGDAVARERDAAQAERDAVASERDAALVERDAAVQLNEQLRPVASAVSEMGLRDRLHVAADIVRNDGRTALIVPVQGDIARREIRVTQPLFEDYCRRIGVDLRIIDVPDGVPGVLVKANLLPIARDYNRFAIVDPDVIIRPGCPDLFSLAPENRLGAVIEGRWTDRSEIRTKLAKIYGLGSSLPAEEYIDTGVMVMGRAHLSLLETLLRGRIAGYSGEEQTTLNALIYHEDVPLHELPRDFNWVPYSPAEFDWRWAWLFHMGDYWPRPPKQETAWQLNRHGRSRFCTQVPLAPRHCRLSSLSEVVEQMKGNDVYRFHPADMGYHMPSAWLVLGADQGAVMWCEASAREMPVIYGPYAVLQAGRWSVTLIGPDGETPLDGGIVVDVVSHHGVKTVRPPAPIGEDGAFELLLREDVVDAEIRMYGSGRDYGVGCILIRAIDADGGNA